MERSSSAGFRLRGCVYARHQPAKLPDVNKAEAEGCRLLRPRDAGGSGSASGPATRSHFSGPVAKRPAEDRRRGAALGEKQVRSCRGWNEEAVEEKPARSQGSRWGIATERRSGGHGRGSRTAMSHPGLVPKPSGPGASKREGSRSTGGCDAGTTGATLIHPLGTFPPETVPGVPSPRSGHPG